MIQGLENSLLFSYEPIAFLHQWDRILGPFLEFLSILCHFLGSGIFFSVLLSFVFLSRSREQGIYLCFSLLLVGVMNSLLKFWFEYPRPIQVPLQFFNMNEASRAGGFGFPSGHVHTATVMWGWIYLKNSNKIYRSICIILIILMPWSRMYLGAHYLGDVIGGFLFGCLTLYFVYRIHKRFTHFPMEFNYFGSGNQEVTRSLTISMAFTLPLLFVSKENMTPTHIETLQVLYSSAGAFVGFFVGLFLLKNSIMGVHFPIHEISLSQEYSLKNILYDLSIIISVLFLVYILPSLIMRKYDFYHDPLVRYVRYGFLSMGLLYGTAFIKKKLAKGKEIGY